jgi:hypothetical protein
MVATLPHAIVVAPIHEGAVHFAVRAPHPCVEVVQMPGGKHPAEHDETREHECPDAEVTPEGLEGAIRAV